MVVIAIISILMCILLPALRNARNLAQRIGCANNLKQIGLGFSYYLNDNSEHFPYNVIYSVGDPSWWQVRLDGYLNEKDYVLFKCMAEPDMYFIYTYGVNSTLCPTLQFNGTVFPSPGPKLTMLTKPASTFLLMDGKQDSAGVDYRARTDPLFVNASAANRHQSGMNVLYVDNHAEWQKPIPGYGLTRTQMAQPNPDDPYNRVLYE